MYPIIPCVGVVVIKDGKVLLVKHGQKAHHVNDVYGLPAGKIEPGETEVGAATRELQEETGLVTVESDLVEFPDNKFSADIAWKDGGIRTFPWTVFYCKQYSGELISSEETIPEWVEISKIQEYNLLPNVDKAVANVLKSL